MNRLQSELHRLYLPHAAGAQDTDVEESSLTDANGQVRSMVLELSGPADWDALSKVWRGVQGDLDLPAPAIAVTGLDGYQLWFSLAEPLPAPQAITFLESLRVRYLSDIAPKRVVLMPSVDVMTPRQVLHARLVPALQAHTGNWSAFVAPDLAPVFADAPWLDIPPNAEGQSNLLSRLQSIKPADFQIALDRLRPAMMPTLAEPASLPPDTAVACQNPKRFLINVMTDEAVALGLRIEAAKALLPYFEDHPSLRQ